MQHSIHDVVKLCQHLLIPHFSSPTCIPIYLPEFAIIIVIKIYFSVENRNTLIEQSVILLQQS